MDSKVKLKAVKGGGTLVTNFRHAQEILRNDPGNDFKLDDKKYNFVNNELIKRPSNSDTKKPKESDSDSSGKKVSK